MDDGYASVSAEVGPMLDFLDPNYVTRLAYVIHTAGDRARTNDVIEPLVLRQIRLFERLCARYSDPVSMEGIFVSRIHNIAIGIAGDITRRKRDFLSDVEAADREYEVLYSRLTKSNGWSIVVRAAVAVAKLVFLGAVGLLISRILAPYIPSAIAHQTGTRAPSVLATFVTLIIGGWLGYRITEFNRQSIEATRNWAKQEARLKYDRGRLLAFRQSWGELRAAWERYTGRQYLEPGFFELLLDDDLRQDTEYYRQLRLHQRSMVVVVIEACRGAAATCTRQLRRQRDAARVS